MIGIYKIENLINGKVYIGQSKNIEERWLQHKRIAEKINYDNRKSYIHQAIKKYGIENFVFEILEICNINELDEKEKKWIQYYHSYINDFQSNGYNLTTGGQGKQKISDIDIQNFIKLWNEGLTIGEIKVITGFCQETIVQHLKKFCNTYNPIESTQRCYIRPVGMSKSVNQYNIKGELLKQFHSISAASKALNISKTALERHLKYETKICSGYIFILSTENQIEGLKKHLNMPGNTKQKPIMKITLDDQLINCYQTALEAAKSCNINCVKTIRKCCQGKLLEAYNYKWKFLDETILFLNKNSIYYTTNDGYCREELEY